VTAPSRVGYAKYTASREESVSHSGWSHRTFLIAFAATAIVACSEDPPTTGGNSPLAGLKSSVAGDSAGSIPAPTPPPASTPTPGYVHGTVRAPGANAQPGQDTLATSVKIAGAIVTAYPRVVQGTDTAGVGPVAAQVVTDANGQFTLPTLPGGEYVITFNPPKSLEATYGGVWTIGTIHDRSHEFPWWITLWKKP
jgi:hypothetical protein